MIALPLQKSRLVVLAAILLLAGKQTAFAQPAQKQATVSAAPMRFAYLLKSGDSRRYAITVTFRGHVPSFNDPFVLAAQIECTATVRKEEDKGTVVAFTVDSASVGIPTKKLKPDGTLDPTAQIISMMSLPEVRQTLNIWATFKPDGAFLDSMGGNPDKPYLNIGFDLRRLILITMPLTFPDRPLHVGDIWQSEGGVIGTKDNKAAYTNKVIAILPGAKEVRCSVRQEAGSIVDDVLDSNGRHTDDPKLAAGTLKGTISLTSEVTFVGAAGQDSTAQGGVKEVHSLLIAAMERIVPDQDEPGKKRKEPVNIRGHIFVKAL